MNIVEKFKKKARSNENEAPVTIAFLGDSVTQGCFELYKTGEASFKTVFDKNSAYHTYIARILAMLYPTVPVNIINAGISGDSAWKAVDRLERDVLRFHPDLTVVCFGLNDCGGEYDGLERYKSALSEIFDRLKEAGSEILFMTPNMMSTEVSSHITDAMFRNIAENASRRQNEGILAMYLEAAKIICKERCILICDCYAKWQLLYESGVDITELLSNQINHPIREMQWMFAIFLVESMLQ